MQAIKHHSNSSLCPYHQCQRSWSVLWRPRRPPRTNTRKRCAIHQWELECKSRRPRDTWNNRQVWLWRTKWSRAKANWILPRECIGYSKYPFSTTWETIKHMDITNRPITKSNRGQFSVAEDEGSCIQSAKISPGADHQLLIAKLMLKIK